MRTQNPGVTNRTAAGPSLTENVVSVDVRGATAWVTLNRPERLNAVTPEMLDDLAAALSTIAPREDVAAVVLTGAGRAFCAGGDLRSPRPTATRSEQVVELRSAAAATIERLRTMDQVTIAAVNGPCAGMGVGLAAACDLRVLAEEAVVNTAYLGAGLSGDFGVAWLLSRILGGGIAADWLLRPRKVGANEALTRGFASEILPQDQLMTRVTEIAVSLERVPTTARRHAKANLIDAGNTDLSTYLTTEAFRHVDAKADTFELGENR